MYDDLILKRVAPEKRSAHCDKGREYVLPEAAVMLAFAMHLFKDESGVRHVHIHPDGMHGRDFKIREWLEQQGFIHGEGSGRTTYAGVYRKGDRTLTVSLNPGLADVTAKGDGPAIIAECKGGCINTTHPGQVSHLRKRLYEAVGHLISRDAPIDERHIAVVPDAKETRKLAQRMVARARIVNVEIALVDAATGQVHYMQRDAVHNPTAP